MLTEPDDYGVQAVVARYLSAVTRGNFYSRSQNGHYAGQRQFGTVRSMKTQVSARGTAAATPCPWCGTGVATTLWPGEDEPVFVDHPLPAPRGRLRCPASGLTRSEVEPPAATR